MKTRRDFLGFLGRLGLSGIMAPFLAGGQAKAQAASPQEHFDLVVIGTGFGGTMTSLSVAYNMESKLAGGPAPTSPLQILMLERGTWWTTPLETVQDKQVNTREFLIWHKQPTQEWTSLNDARGMIDLVRRCRRSKNRPQGLYDFSPIGKQDFFGFKNDGVSVLRASGVGGGSLVYSNITIRPPETVFDDSRWPGSWHGAGGAAARLTYCKQAAEAISHGVEALIVKGGAAVNTGLSNIVTRSARLAPPRWEPKTDPTIPPTDGSRPLLQIKVRDEHKPLQADERELIDRARVFQTAIAKLTPHYGTVDLAINDIAPEPDKPDAKPRGKNYCERQGRCNIGCLPGARHTLNKQLMRALYGDFTADAFDPQHPVNSNCVLKHVGLELRALAEVDVISQAADGSYVINYRQRRIADPQAFDNKVISADRVIVAGGCLGTTELMLHCQQRGVDANGSEGLRDLSDKLGFGFSPNGDHIAFMDNTKERVSLTRGPVTTSFGQFNAEAPQAKGFHNVEDQGIPRSLAALTGYGFQVMQALARGDGRFRRLPQTIVGFFNALHEIFTLNPRRKYPSLSPQDMSGDRPESEDELTAKTMCVVVQGKDDAIGQFRLEDNQLRVMRSDGKAFHEDGIYKQIHDTLDRLAALLRPEGSEAKFVSPFSDATLPGQKPVVLTSHPLGGCPMGDSVSNGVVDEWGRVFRKGAPEAYYKGLYIADGSVIPTALGVNPSLTIAAVALHTAEKVLAEWSEIPARGQRTAAAPQCKA